MIRCGVKRELGLNGYRFECRDFERDYHGVCIIDLDGPALSRIPEARDQIRYVLATVAGLVDAVAKGSEGRPVEPPTTRLVGT
jgi:hypothetical protein